ADWKHAYQPNLPGKESITIRIDRGVLSWFRAKGGRYQTRINNALREYMDDHIQGRRPVKAPLRRAAEVRAGFRGKTDRS
ncbi:MAG: BrnA antitoxin family protein, partial [Rhodospirillales bacterium]